MKFRKILAAMTLSAIAVTAAVPAVAAQPTIVSRAIAINGATGEFDTLLAAATCDYFDGAIVNALSTQPQKTLFAPTDQAFTDIGLDAATVCPAFAGTEEKQAALADILLYHVTPGRRPTGWIAQRSSLPMANGDRATVSRIGGALAVDGARIVIRNVPAANGFIHAVDAVLLP
jgi:uncharacterized surface protein with fasciclin (FAS1) repeats